MTDVNGSRFHLLAGRRDWQPLAGGTEDLVWDDERAVVHLRPELLRLEDRQRRRVLGPEARRGAARDPYGHVWWIDDERRGLRFSSAGDPRRATTAWSVGDLRRGCEPSARRGTFRTAEEPEPPPVPTLSGLAATAHGYLVAGTLEPGGFLVFDLHAGGPPSWRRWAELDLRPFDLAADDHGGVWVLDRDPAVSEARLWYLDRHFRLTPAAETASSPPEADDIALTEATLTEAVALAALPGCDLLVLESDPSAPASRVHLLRDGSVVDTLTLEGALASILAYDAPPGAADLKGHDLAVVGSTLFIAEDDGQQVFAFELAVRDDTLGLRALESFLPMRGFSGKALVEVPPGEVLYDFGERWLPLAEQPRRRFARRAELAGLRFDGKAPGVVWHRLLLDACIPAGDAVAVASRVAEREELLDQEPWNEEPAPYLRAGSSEIPFHQPWSSEELERGRTGTWELLFQAARGRFLELRLTLSGSGRTTPKIRALRAWYPRFSYLEQYLPAVYREDPASASFLDRYLANPEGTLTEIEGKVERAQTLFDTDGAPSEALDWLAGWLGALLDPEWDDARRRLFLAHAEKLFRWRGTRGGLLRAIRLAIDPCPDESLFHGLGTAESEGSGVRIVESFLLRRFPGMVLGDPTGAGPSLIARGAPWEPSHGVARLHELYRESLRRVGVAHFAGERFPPTLPADAERAEHWRHFVESEIAFTYAPANAADPRDQALYRDFLARRHGSAASLDAAHERRGAGAVDSLRGVEMPVEMPAAGEALFDWVRFVSQVLPIKTRAHRFTVLVPAVPGEDPEERERRRARVEEVVRREKPAHTDFDVELFWDLFQVGSARLGLDTQLGEGSRFTALALGLGNLDETYLTLEEELSRRTYDDADE